MNQYERGKHMPDFNTVENLCAVLDVPPAYLYCGDDDLASVIAAYPRLTSDDKKRVLEVVKSVDI